MARLDSQHQSEPWRAQLDRKSIASTRHALHREESTMMPKEYLQEVRSLVESVRSILSEKEVSEVEHLIDHDEPVEGLRTLAWIIHDEGKAVIANTRGTILKLIGDSLAQEDLPPHFGAEIGYDGGRNDMTL